jgi:uncharacterized SAM-binding protein YcdF (DUF218 family)
LIIDGTTVALFLSKLLPLFVYPLGLATLLLVLGLLLSVRRSPWIARLFVLLAIAVLWGASTPYVAGRFAFGLENEFPRQPIDGVGPADAILLLGGIVSEPKDTLNEPNIGAAVDRLFAAARLYRAGKAPVIVALAGNLPWASVARPEAEVLADLLVELGVPRDAIVLDTKSRNTRENAVNAAAIFAEKGWKRGLLVTSALHMPRAFATFQKVGLDVVPVPADFQAQRPFFESGLDLLPNADALALSTSAIKELIGAWAYRWRGWV